MPSFPVDGLLPKAETQALKFIDAHKTRGAGIRIAVLDTGIDPHAVGLTDRVVDIIDATGAGDVQLKEAQLAQSDTLKSLAVQGSSGRHLLLNPSWKNPTGTWKVGHKLAYDLWPDDLVSRRKTERKQAFAQAQAALLSAAQKDLNAFEAAQKDAKKELAEDAPDPAKLKKADLQDKIAVLKALATDFEDVGPVLDVVAWHDGQDWRVVVGGAEGSLAVDDVPPPLSEIDADGKGDQRPAQLDLSHLKPMTDFRKERHFETFGKQDLLSYSVNFYDDGDIVSIVVVSGSHGTHVAGIIAANHPEEPELNGVAPEAELVSIRIGDPRVHGMETNQALVRATRAILDSGSQLANMSFGEDGAWGVQHKGAFITQLVEEVIRKRDVIFVTSAGNSGPALTTIGALPAGSEAVFSVGAWVSGKMQDAEYALIDRVPSSVYTWSSRGPAFDGSRAILAYAPGAAITSVPRYNLKHSQLMNGTSMASPSLCGNVALLLSKLKQDKKTWTPARVRKAIDATSKSVQDPLGIGLIQLSDAYDYLLAHYKESDEDAEWLVQVTPPGRERALRGVYLRQAQETDRLQTFQVELKPKFKTQDTDKVYSLDLQLLLSCDAKWVEKPAFAVVNGLGRAFPVRVDPSQLEPGLHATQIEARTQAGRLVAKIPITVAKPTPAVPFTKFSTTFSPGQIERNFIAVPEGATWAEVTVKSSNRDTPAQFWLHAVQLVDLTRLSHVDVQAVYALTAGEPQSKKFAVQGGITLELVATQAWNTSGKTDIELTIDFHGIHLLNGPELSLDGGVEIQQIAVGSAVRPEAIAPSIKFEAKRSVLRPKESQIRTLSSRNDLPNGQGRYELLLTYSFKQSKKAGVTTRFATDGHLYDGPFSVLSVTHDKSRRFFKWGDVYPKEQQLEKGDYTVQLQIVHEQFSTLEKLKGLALVLETKLAKAVTLDLYADHVEALTSGKPYKFDWVRLQPRTSKAAIVKTRLEEDAYTDASAGDVLVGEYHLTPASFKLGRPATLLVPPSVPKEKDESEDDKEKQQLVDLQIELSGKIEDAEVKKQFLDDLRKEHADHLPLLVAILESYDPKKAEDESAILAAADDIFNLVDEEALARFNGVQKSNKTAKDRKEAKRQKLQQDALLKAFDRKLRVLVKHRGVSDDESYDKITSSASSSASSVYSSYESTLAGYERWAAASDSKLTLHLIQRDLDEGRYASALVKARKILADLGPSSDDADAKEAHDFIAKALKELGWTIYRDAEARVTLAKDILF